MLEAPDKPRFKPIVTDFNDGLTKRVKHSKKMVKKQKTNKTKRKTFS